MYIYIYIYKFMCIYIYIYYTIHIIIHTVIGRLRRVARCPAGDAHPGGEHPPRHLYATIIYTPPPINVYSVYLTQCILYYE